MTNRKMGIQLYINPYHNIIMNVEAHKFKYNREFLYDNMLISSFTSTHSPNEVVHNV
jgi:hypothetical protein